MDAAIATSKTLPEPDDDEPIYLEALRAAGVDARVLAWDDDAAPFSEAKLVVIRSTWGYIHRLDEYLAWVDRVGARLLNPPALVRWNAHKRYLLELEAAGVPTTPTALAPRGSTLDLVALMAARGWEEVVVKPAVSAGSFETRRLARPSAEELVWLAALLAARDVLVQPFVRSVEGYGERSLITVEGEVTHAIRKSPRWRDDQENVSAEAIPIADDERALALRALEAARPHGEPMYGRVDMARDEHGTPRVMELELIEPSMFFPQHPPAARRWAEAIARRLGE